MLSRDRTANVHPNHSMRHVCCSASLLTTGQSRERVFSVIIILGQCGQTKTRTQPIGLLGRINKPAFVFIIQMGLSTMYR